MSLPTNARHWQTNAAYLACVAIALCAVAFHAWSLNGFGLLFETSQGEGARIASLWNFLRSIGIESRGPGLITAGRLASEICSISAGLGLVWLARQTPWVWTGPAIGLAMAISGQCATVSWLAPIVAFWVAINAVKGRREKGGRAALGISAISFVAITAQGRPPLFYEPPAERLERKQQTALLMVRLPKPIYTRDGILSLPWHSNGGAPLPLPLSDGETTQRLQARAYLTLLLSGSDPLRVQAQASGYLLQPPPAEIWGTGLEIWRRPE